MAQVLMLYCNVIVRQHGHVPDLALFLLRDSRAETQLVFLQIVQTGLDGLYGFLVQGEVGQDDTFIDVCTGNRFVGILKVLFQQALFDLKGYFQGLESIFVLFIFFVNAAEVIEAECA